MKKKSLQYDFWKDYTFFTNPVVQLAGFSTKIDCKIPVFRARKYEKFDIASREEMQYPPKDKCNITGRANLPFHPVFYGSYDKECAVNELNLETGTEVAVSEWYWKENISLNVKLFSKMDEESESILRKYNVRTIKEFVDLCYSKYGKQKQGDFYYDMINRMNTMCDLFLNKEDYFGSAIVAFEELYRSRLNRSIKNSDVLIYPSIKTPQSVNLAIHPEIVDNYLEYKKSCTVRVL